VYNGVSADASAFARLDAVVALLVVLLVALLVVLLVALLVALLPALHYWFLQPISGSFIKVYTRILRSTSSRVGIFYGPAEGVAHEIPRS
jgi:ABC-type arginine/histidine transport system permease subunit